MVFDEKGPRRIKHGAQHRSNFFTFLRELIVISRGQVPTITCKIKPRIGLGVLPIRIGQFAYKMSLIPALRPRLSQIRAN